MILQYWTIVRLHILSLIATYCFSGYGEPTSSPLVVQRDADSPHSKRRRMLHFPDPTICNERTDSGIATFEVGISMMFLYFYVHASLKEKLGLT